MIIRKLKNFFKRQKFFIELIAILSRGQYSAFFPIAWAAKLLCAPLYYFFGEDYFKLLMFVQKSKIANKKSESAVSSRFLPDIFLIRALTGDKTINMDDYVSFLDRTQLNVEGRFEWAQHFMGLGRLDLAQVGFLDLTQRNSSYVPLEVQFKALRYLGIVHFLSGRNDEANYFWRLTGQLRGALLKPSTPKGYRILGPGWHAAFGHIGQLDYYIKYLKLFGEKDIHVVAPWQPQQIPWTDLINKFEPLGIKVVTPENLEEDYNQWAMRRGYPRWDQLSSAEIASFTDEFWEFNFPDGEVLGVTYALARIQREWEKAQHQPLFFLSEMERQWISNYLSYLGVPADAWYVCLHVREAGFHKDWNSLYPSMRDANINDYTLAIEKIVNAGGWVLRMGDPSMKPLAPMRNVVDYAHSPYKSQTADVFLGAGCKFILGTNSGYVNVCAMYNVPCALTNWVPIGWPLWLRHDLMIPKLFRDKNTGQYLSLEEIFEQGLAFLQNWSDLPSNIELVANTPEEIAQITLEMLAQCNLAVEQPRMSVGASAIFEDYYRSIAKQYGSYMGSRLARTFVEKHADIFLPSEQLLAVS